ncbi:MAG: ATP-dependent RNA helicase HrpA [Syntrophobacteraceae bacterium]
MTQNTALPSSHTHAAAIRPMLALNYPPELPITERREEIVRAIRENQVVVITGETGSGKSTQIPKMCMEAGRGQDHLIGCTQPRRIAAITLSQRVTEELGRDGPRLVGYKIRFQDRTARSTRIKFMTDGILLAEAQRDHRFRAYDTIIVDEAHERTLNIDFLLGLLLRILPTRPDLKVVVTSATIDPWKFSRAFGNAPMIEVSGRTYPVDLRYQPLDEAAAESEDVTHIDHAVAAVDGLKARARERGGDILIFMPTESDIRETVQRLEERRYFNTLVHPLFGRMAASDQQRIFRTTSEEKIIVATNVAETSVTIPGIRYVVDTGLARMSQYNARSRTQGLPVTRVSRASADQRKGRCGRVEAGVCIRLYSREDYEGRSEFTPPEILRSNLADVILRMLYLQLGNIQDFPFLDPPSPVAVKDGFGVLKELGAVDEHRRLTPLGRTMARLPLDPRLARMIVEARKEGALTELIVLVAALSAQDPRERPLDQEAQADQAHATFRDPRSDFLTLLKIWRACFEDPEKPSSQSQMRRFCRERFLSYRRLREWKDIHDEIVDILDEMGGFHRAEASPDYSAIHRSLLSGYLSHIGMRKEKNLYLATKNRQVMIFPGSGLFNKAGGWVMASELVQTSRLFARTVANVEPEWIEQLGRHLCKSSYSEPHWEKNRGQVVAFERVTLYGLPVVERRKVNFGRVNLKEARSIFIRSGLVEGEMAGRYGFLDHNRELIERIQELESKTRRRDLLVDEETLFQFYEARMPEIADVRSLDRFIKDAGGDTILRMSEQDLLRAEPDFEALDQFPDRMRLDDLELPLRYNFHPGEDDDGVTVLIPIHALKRVSSPYFEWLVPGMIEELILTLLKALPKGIRRQLVPVGDMARRLRDGLVFGDGALAAALSRRVVEVAGVSVPGEMWSLDSVPPHLRMRFEVIGSEGNVLGAGRDLDALRSLSAEAHGDRLWTLARKQWEKDDLPLWDFGDFPTRVLVGKDALGIDRYGYPGLVFADGKLCARLHEDVEEALRVSRDALWELYRLAFAAELKQLRRTWVVPASPASVVLFLGGREKADSALQNYVLRELFELHDPQPPDRHKYQATVERFKGRLGSSGQELADEVVRALGAREEARASLARFRGMAAGNRVVLERIKGLEGELDQLAPPDMLVRCRREDVARLPRYLSALRLRGERAYVSPEKDRVKARQIEPHLERYRGLLEDLVAGGDEEAARFAREYRWMIEDLKVNVFAPEIRTTGRVSAKRLDEAWERWTKKRPMR